MDRPFVYVNMAMTADGKITSAGREYPTFTSRHDKKTMDRLRAEADAVLVGARTVRADDPPLGVRDPEMRAYRRSLGKPDELLAVVVTSGTSLDPKSRFFGDAAAGTRIVATTAAASPILPDGVEVWRLGDERVDLRELLARLKRRGVERLLAEGGGELNWGLFRDDLVDELYVTVAPSLLGGSRAPTLLEGDGFAMEQRRRLRLLSVERHGDEIYCRYAIVR